MGGFFPKLDEKYGDRDTTGGDALRAWRTARDALSVIPFSKYRAISFLVDHRLPCESIEIKLVI